jgi:hypothetical protein
MSFTVNTQRLKKVIFLSWVLVAPAYNPGYLGVLRLRGSQFDASPGKQLRTPPSPK